MKTRAMPYRREGDGERGPSMGSGRRCLRLCAVPSRPPKLRAVASPKCDVTFPTKVRLHSGPKRRKKGRDWPIFIPDHTQPNDQSWPDLTSNRAISIEADQAMFRAVPGLNERGLNEFIIISYPGDCKPIGTLFLLAHLNSRTSPLESTSPTPSHLHKCVCKISQVNLVRVVDPQEEITHVPAQSYS
jgi:hypothetical protein